MKLKVFFMLCLICLILVLIRQICMPCELLVMARNDTDELKGQYAKYDVVVIEADNWSWGTSERLPLFYIVKLPQVSVEQAKRFIDPGVGIRRKMALRISAVPIAIKNDLLDDGVVTIDYPASTILNYILDK